MIQDQEFIIDKLLIGPMKDKYTDQVYWPPRMLLKPKYTDQDKNCYVMYSHLCLTVYYDRQIPGATT